MSPPEAYLKGNTGEERFDRERDAQIGKPETRPEDGV